MILDFSRPGMAVIFEITADKSVALKHLSCNGVERNREKKLPYCNVAELQITGGSTFDIHFAKHTGSWGSRKLRYVSHTYKPNEWGDKLEILLSSGDPDQAPDGGIELTAHYQFYRDAAAVRSWSTVKNNSRNAVGLEYVSSFCYTGFDDGDGTPNEKLRVYIPHNSWLRELNWKEYNLSDLGFERSSNVSGKRIMVSNTGTWSCKEHLPMGAVRNTATNNTWLWQIESNGSWQWELADVSNTMYDSHGMIFQKHMIETVTPFGVASAI